MLIPRPETEVVAQIAIAEIARTGERVGPPDPWGGALTAYAVADLGTGSGALALALAFALPEAEVWATEVDPGALTVARANVAGAGTPAARVRVAEGSWFAALPAELKGHLRAHRANPAVHRGPKRRPAERSGALGTGGRRSSADRPDAEGSTHDHPGGTALAARPRGRCSCSSRAAPGPRPPPTWPVRSGSHRSRCARTWLDATACSSPAARRTEIFGRAFTRFLVVADELDVDAMLSRFRDRASRVKERGMPPVAGPERERFLEQAALDFQDYAIVGDATWTFEDGILTLRVDLTS